MPWNERIREAAYTPPSGITSGKRFVFNYENVRKLVDKKTTGFNFPDAEGTFVQDMGHSGRRYPLRIFFWGDDYDIEANAFELALLESGTGKLEHPVYGTVNVVPFGRISRRDDLKTAANQAVIDVVFWETIGLIYPAVQDDPASEVLNAVNKYNTEKATEFEEITDLDSAIEQSSLKNSYQVLLDGTSNTLQDIANTQDDVRQQFNAIKDSINQGIDILISDPLTLAFQTTQLLQSPARALTNIVARLDAYNGLIDSIITSVGAITLPGRDSRNSNEFHTKDLYVSTYVTGSVVSVVNNQFTTKTEAIEAAEAILTQFENITNWRDDNYQSLEEIDTGSAYQQLQESVALTAGFLVEISFTLKQERRFILDRNRTYIDLVPELYGETDDQYDFFITSNNLSGDEMFELPKGREIVYYI